MPKAPANKLFHSETADDAMQFVVTEPPQVAGRSLAGILTDVAALRL
jgi:hypothetical protein